MKKRRLQLTGDGSHTIFLPELDETYHSTHGAIQESNHVFIAEGLQFFQRDRKVEEIRIFELGFGTGLNALLTAIFAERHGIKIIYETIEAFPLDADMIGALNYTKQIASPSAHDLFANLHESEWNETVSISDYFSIKKIDRRFQDFEVNINLDICYYDAFAPSKQPDMWEKPLLEKVYNALREGGIFVTYCAKGQLKRDLGVLGFEVATVAGPPGKLQMVRAVKI